LYLVIATLTNFHEKAVNFSYCFLSLYNFRNTNPPTNMIMKNLIAFIVLTALFTFNGYSQYEKGAFQLSGYLSLSSQEYNYPSQNPGVEDQESSYLSTSFRPKIGIFISEHLEIGLDFGISYWRDQDVNDRINSGFGIPMETFLRYYAHVSDQVSLFLHGGVGYEFEKHNTEDPNWGDSSTKYHGMNVLFYPGFQVSLTRVLKMNLTFGLVEYSYRIESGDEDTGANDTSSSIYFRMNSIGIGLSYLF